MTVFSKVKQTLDTLKGAQGTLRIYSIQERDEKAKAAYDKALEVTHEIIEDIEDIEARVQTLELEEPQYKEN
ncbi:MAG: DUF1657 domain-containing protein [Clostridiaceae bacterium]|nr:DUF1657 domain-containing protein [Clostridiaceae bacterium]